MESGQVDTLIIPGGCGLPLAEVIESSARWMGERGKTTRRIVFSLHGIYGCGDGCRWPSRTDALALCERCREAVPKLRMEPTPFVRRTVLS